MTKKELEEYAEMVADLTASKVMALLNSNGNVSSTSEWIETKEAAEILRVTPSYLRSIKDKFSIKKVGGSERGRVLFNREEINKYYLNGRRL